MGKKKDISPPVISRALAKKALLRSGYLLESRLSAVLTFEGYYTEANAAYPDPLTGKSREFDLHAITALKAGPEEYDFLFANLVIECINNPQPVVFITGDIDIEFLRVQRIKLAGLPAKIWDATERGWMSLPNYLDMEDYHHYCKGPLATQFCSFAPKKNAVGKQDWMAHHDERQFDAFRTLSAVVEHHVDEKYKQWEPGGKEYVNIDLYYPVVVFQGELLEAKPTKRSLALRRTDHVHYRLSIFTGNQAAEYQIDVVTERFFPKYLEIIDKETTKMARLLRRRRDVVRTALDLIEKKCRRLRSPDKIRAAIEFKGSYGELIED